MRMLQARRFSSNCSARYFPFTMSLAAKRDLDSEEHRAPLSISFCSASFVQPRSLSAFMSFRSSLLSRLSPGFVAMAVVSSLSSGAILSVVVQAMLIGWDKVTAAVTRRWAILATIVLTAYLVVDAISNRSPIDVFISYLTFNADTSYMRVHIWNYGTQSVMKHPILGVGLNDWERPFGWAAVLITFGWVRPSPTAFPAFCS